MNPLLTDETILDHFENHLSGKMSPMLKVQFVEKLNSDPELQEAYRIFLLSREVIGQKINEDLKSQLKQWNEEALAGKESTNSGQRSTTPGRIRNLVLIRRIAVAAGVLLLMTFSFFEYKEIKRFPDLAISKYQDIRNNADRGSFLESKVNQIILDYVRKTQSLDETINGLKQIAPDVPGIDYYKAQNYLGKLYLRQGKCELMANSYQISSTLIGYKYDGDIAQVLCAIKSGSKPEEVSVHLKKILDNPNHTYYEQAVEIDRKINSFWWSLFN